MINPIIASHTIAVRFVISNCPAADRCDSFADALVASGPTPPPDVPVTVSNPAASACPNSVTDANGTILVPTTRSELPSDIAVPKTVMAVLP